MHKEILSKKQDELLILIKQFIREYYLVGGTAIALHIGHRRSIDFDLFKYSTIKHSVNLKKISSFKYQYNITRRVAEQMNLIINEVKITFYQYPFKIDAACRFEDVLRLPELIDLAAMKAYALGRRSKWKDYVDLYFIIKNYYSIDQISKRAIELFDQMFSEKLFRAQ
jgi:nucleotidyltransferase AbiEii toxin of type IV toxin-antitoxin system